MMKFRTKLQLGKAYHLSGSLKSLKDKGTVEKTTEKKSKTC